MYSRAILCADVHRSVCLASPMKDGQTSSCCQSCNLVYLYLVCFCIYVDHLIVVTSNFKLSVWLLAFYVMCYYYYYYY